jgi:hypothetical protein
MMPCEVQRQPEPPRRTSRLLLRIALFSVFAFSMQPLWSQSSATSGYEVKTAFLFNFAKFVGWPPASFPSSDSPFTICVLGQDPFGNILDNTLQGQVIDNRPFAIRRLRDRSEVRGCQMVFVSSSENAHLAEILASVQGTNLLLVGDMTGFAAMGGTIEFTIEDNRVRFTINTDAVDRSGLKLNSKLLGLARIVHDEKHSKGG